MNTPQLHELVSLIVLARHGKAVSAEGRPDSERELNELGVRQANALGFAIQEFGIDVVLSSPLKRAMNTTRIATNEMFAIKPVAELACTDDATDPINVMWTKLGNAPLSQYFAHELGEHLKLWGRVALDAIIRELDEKTGQKILVSGHAVLINAITWAIAWKLQKKGIFGSLVVATLAENTLNEGEAFVIRFVDGQAEANHLRPMAK